MPPPKLSLKLLKWFCKPEYHKDIEGDLLELHDRRKKTSSQTKANWRLFKDVLLLFRPGIIRSFKTSQKLNYTAMLRHNFILTIRNFKRYRTSFLINLIGLSTGLASALLIYLWVSDELKVDKFHEKDDRLYQVMRNFDRPNGIVTRDLTPTPLAEALAEEMPEVEYAVSVNDFFSWRSKEGILSNGDKQTEAKGLHASRDYFHVFSYDLIRGDKDKALVDKNSIVISEELAKILFNSTENIIGKTLEWNHAGFDGTFQVSGIFEEIPSNSTAQFDVIFSIEVLLENDRWAKNWTNSYAQTYLILSKGANITHLNKEITRLFEVKNPSNKNLTLFVRKYSSKYLFGQYENGVQAGGRITYVRLFSIIALIILLIACINFMNLSTAQASKKMKEIGVKKVIGASRNSLINQFLGESILAVFLSLIIALLFVWLLLPQFNEITGKQLDLNIDASAFLSVLGIGFFTSFVSGSYPAFYLAGFSPITVLKGKLRIAFGELWVRKGLVVFQFSLSIIFIVGVLVIKQQIELTQTQNMGYDRDNIISFQWKGNLYDPWNGLLEGKSNERFYAFMQELKNIPGVVSTTNMSGNILNKIPGQSGVSWRGQESDKDFLFQSPVVGYDYIETLGIELSEGRSFSRDYNDDYSKIILNEAAVKAMELENPVGEIIKMNGRSEIIGVVKNFHYGSLHNQVDPLIFRFEPHGKNILAKIVAGTERITIEGLKKLYEQFLPGYTFEFSFLDDDYQALYDSENKVSILSKYFAGLAIVISCLGLFGLATFTAERRMKEIGVRKIMGSSVFGIIRMLTGDFTKTVIVAIFISLPISYLIAKNWLDNFAYKIDLNGWFFAEAGLLVLLIAWVTIGMQTIKAARVNPVECLKDE